MAEDGDRFEVSLEAVEAPFPLLAERLQPGVGDLQGRRHQSSGPALGVALLGRTGELRELVVSVQVEELLG